MRTVIKSLAEAVALVLVLPHFLLYRLAVLAMGSQPAFAGSSQWLALYPGLAGTYLRRAFYRLSLPQCGEGCVVSFGVLLTHPGTTLGDHAYIGPYGCLGELTIERDVLIGSHVSITNGSRQHGIARLELPVREQPGEWPRITIGEDSWIGDRAVIMASVGCHCVVGAGAVVTKPVPDFAIVAGVPARIIGSRQDPELKIAGETASPVATTEG